MENERNKVVYSILSSRGLSGKVSLYRRSIGKLPRFLLLRSVRMKWTSPSRIFFLLASTSRFAIPRVQEPFHPRIIAPFRTSLVNDSIETKILNEKLEEIRESTITFNRNTGLKFTHRMPRGRGGGPTILVIFVRKRTRAPNESSSNSQGRAGHVPSGAQPSLMKNVGWLPRRSLNGAVVTEICKHRTALRWFEMDIGPGLLIPRSGLNFETMLNFWFD